MFQIRFFSTAESVFLQSHFAFVSVYVKNNPTNPIWVSLKRCQIKIKQFSVKQTHTKHNYQKNVHYNFVHKKMKEKRTMKNVTLRKEFNFFLPENPWESILTKKKLVQTISLFVEVKSVIPWIL